MALSPEPDPTGDCSVVEHLPDDSLETQQILEEFIQNFKEQNPTEYMGMAILRRVDRLREWAVVQGSVSGDDGNILVVRRTAQEYELIEDYVVTSAFAAEEPPTRVTQYFLEKVPDAPEQLFTCLEQTWFPGREARPTEPPHAYQLVYMGTDNGNTDDVNEIHAIPFDGSEPRLVLSAPMMINELVLSPDGEQLAFWGCPGSIAHDCISPEEDLDVWVVNWDGSSLRNLTEDLAENDAHPSWSPDGNWLAFVSNRGEDVDVYKMCVTCPGESTAIRLTDEVRDANSPAWSPDGNWIAYWDSIGQTLMMVKPHRNDRTHLASGTWGPPLWRP